MCENAFVELSGFKNPQSGNPELRNPGVLIRLDPEPGCLSRTRIRIVLSSGNLVVLSAAARSSSHHSSPFLIFIYLFIWLFLFLRISRLNWTVLNLQLYKYFFLWSSSLRNRNRNMHMEARKYVWEGAIPLQIHLHVSEVTTLPPPPPALVISPLNLFLF